MGIYDREYYRDESGGSGWLSGVAPACKLILAINIGVFVLGLSPQSRAGLFDWLAASPDRIFGHLEVWRLLTAAFVHADLLHLAFNMLILWFFGREMEAMYGTREFASLYVASAVLSTLIWAAASRLLFGLDDAVMNGASGALMAIFVLYALYYPRREILVFFVLPVEIWLLLVFTIGLDLLALLNEVQAGRSFGGTAFAAHLGGAAYGYLYKRFDLRWNRLLSGRRYRPRLRIVPAEPRDRVAPLAGGPGRTAPAAAPKAGATAVLPEEQLDARLDEILAKIAREGRAALTEDENRVLQEASRRARNRRSDRL